LPIKKCARQFGWYFRKVSLAERLLLVAVGGAIGSLCRYLAAVLLGAGALTTFGVNISGSFLIGLVVSVTEPSDLRLRLLLATGFLGGYTTFSAWQLEGLFAAQAKQWGITAAVLFGSLTAGFAAVSAGFWTGLKLR
jgi:CrcB protein